MDVPTTTRAGLFALIALRAIGCHERESPSQHSDHQPLVASRAATLSAHWADRKRTLVNTTVDGVAFTITLPEGLRSDAEGGWVPDDDTLRVFAVVLDGELVTSLDKAKYQSTLHMSETKFVRAEEDSHGYVVTSVRGVDQVEATAFRKAGARWLKCKAIAKLDATSTRAIRAVETICDSVAVQ